MRFRHAILPAILVAEFLFFLKWSGIRFHDPSLFLFDLGLYLEAISTQAAPLLILALGMTIVLMTAGIDLSAGSMTALVACVMSTFDGDVNFWITAVPIGLGVGLGLGLCNGLLIASLDVPPIIATLGTLFFYRGLCYVVRRGTEAGEFSRVPAWGLIPKYTWFGEFPGAILTAMSLLVIGGVWFSWSRWRRELLMLGGNRVAARYAGIPVSRRLVQVYGLMGACAFFAALCGTAREGYVSASWQMGLEFQVIVAVVLGGTRVDGGFGSLVGSLFGVLLVAVLDEGLRGMNQSDLQPMLLGILLITGVWLNTHLTK